MEVNTGGVRAESIGAHNANAKARNINNNATLQSFGIEAVAKNKGVGKAFLLMITAMAENGRPVLETTSGYQRWRSSKLGRGGNNLYSIDVSTNQNAEGAMRIVKKALERVDTIRAQNIQSICDAHKNIEVALPSL